MSRTHTATRTAAVAIAAVALTSACGSSGGSSAPSTPSAPGTSSAPSAGGDKVGAIVYIPGLTGNPFYNTVACGASSEAKKEGVEFSYQGAPDYAVPAQTQVLNAVVATKPGAIMISVTDASAMIGPVTAAKNAGIKIIGIDGDLDDKSLMVTNIQSDSTKGGQLAGEAMAKAVGEKGTVLIIDNATGNKITRERTDGFSEAIAKYPNMKVLPVAYSNNDAGKAASIVSTTVGSNSDVVGVFGAATNNTQGALTGVRESGKAGKIKVVGYDTSEPIVAALKDGTLTGTVVQNPRGEGVAGVQAAVKAMKGEPVEREQASDALFVTPETVDSAKAKSYISDVNCKQ